MTPTARRILVIDDDLDIGEYICAAATRLGHQCIFTASVDEFLSAHSEHTSLLFIDLIMPQIDGVELLRRLAERDCRTPIVLMSGVGLRVMETAEELAQALGLHIFGKLQKPFPHAELNAILERPYTAACPTASKPRREYRVTEADLRTAIEKSQFVVYYQPQIETATNRVAGLEALVRWKHPCAGLIFPDSFIPQLESMGAIDDLFWLVTRRAFADFHLFMDDEGNFPSLSINCTVDSLLDLQFPDRLLDLAAQYRVPPERLTLEITESGLLSQLARTLDVLTRLRMKGVCLSVDDFGTGYSMMRQLRHIPATEIKIDKFFVENIGGSEGDRVIIRKIIEMGRDLGLSVVAEGVETQQQLDFLREAGCDFVQGYLFSKPLPPFECLQWVLHHREHAIVHSV